MIGTIRFAGDFPPVLLAVVATVAALLVTWLYLRETRTLDMPYSYLLPALRASAVVLVILILAGPVWHRRQVIGQLGRVVFAVDVSESMSRTDSTGTQSSAMRLERALRLLTGESESVGWLESLSETHAVDVVAFSSGDPTLIWSSRDEEEIPTTLEVAADGERTDLSSPLATMAASLAPGELLDASVEDPRRAAIVLMTDGRDNLGRSSVDLAQQLKSSGVSVYAVGMGSEDEPADVGIVSVERPDSVASDGRLSGRVLVKQIGMAGQDVVVRIESAGKTVWQQTITAGGAPQQSVPFQLEVEPIVQQLQGNSPRGVRRSTVVMDLRAVVEPVEGDTSSENNALPFRVAASMRDRKLLVLDGSSRWETRYLKNLFGRDPAWTVDSVLFGIGTDMPEVVRGEEPGQLPNTREAMANYDAIILGEIPPDQFTEEDAFQLREFVTRGGGLVVIDGRYDRIGELARESLPELIPVQYLQDELPLEVREIRPTRLGLEHPALNLWGDKERLSEYWEQLPGPQVAARVEAQEGAEVWAHAVATDGRESPWLVTRLFGAGRIFYLSSDETWRWRYKVADRFHARFWNQILTAVMQPPYSASDEYVALGTDKIDYEAGESSTVRVRLQDTAGKPVGDATVDALLIADDHVIATVPLAVDDPARGTYQGQTPPLEPGAYQVRIQASGFDSAALQASTPIWVGKQDSIELRRVSLDKDALNQVVQAAGGAYVHESSADTILESLRPLSSGSVVESDILVWQSFYWFWAVILLLAIEWWMRKRAGLV